MRTDTHSPLHSSTISVRFPHVQPLFYLVTQNRVKHANWVKQHADAAEAFKLWRAHSNHQPSTGTRCERPCCRKACTHFLSETTHLHSHIPALFTSKQHYRKGNWWPSLLSILKVFLTALKNSKKCKNDELAAQLTSHSGVQRVYRRVKQTHRATNIDSSRSCVCPWCRAGRAHSWTATAPPFILTKPPSHPPGPCLLLHLQCCFLHVGGPRHFKAPRVGAPVGWQAATAQLSRIALVNAKQTHVGDRVLATSGFHREAEWNRLMHIKIQITVSHQDQAGNTHVCCVHVLCLSTPPKKIIWHH